MLDYRFSVAPMMDWTDRHCRAFHRCLSKRALLWTEMVTADAVVHGDRQRLLSYNECEHPVVLQLGGSEPGKLAEAARIAEARRRKRISTGDSFISETVFSHRSKVQLVEDAVEAGY